MPITPSTPITAFPIQTADAEVNGLEILSLMGGPASSVDPLRVWRDLIFFPGQYYWADYSGPGYPANWQKEGVDIELLYEGLRFGTYTAEIIVGGNLLSVQDLGDTSRPANFTITNAGINLPQDYLTLSGGILYLSTDVFDTASLSITGTFLKSVKHIGTGSLFLQYNNTITTVESSANHADIIYLGRLTSLKLSGATNIYFDGLENNQLANLAPDYTGCALVSYTAISSPSVESPLAVHYADGAEIVLSSTIPVYLQANQIPSIVSKVENTSPGAKLDLSNISQCMNIIYIDGGVNALATDNDDTLNSITNVGAFSGAIITFITGGVTPASATIRAALVNAGCTVVF
jgi:hypothetical protein